MLVVHGLEFDPLEYEDYVAVRAALQKAFTVVLSYTSHVPSLGESAFLVASNGPDPSVLPKSEITKRLSERGVNDNKDIGQTLIFYDADAHVRMFSLPKNVKAVLSEGTSELEGVA